jgi:hypothetical protein
MLEDREDRRYDDLTKLQYGGKSLFVGVFVAGSATTTTTTTHRHATA